MSCDSSRRKRRTAKALALTTDPSARQTPWEMKGTDGHLALSGVARVLSRIENIVMNKWKKSPLYHVIFQECSIKACTRSGLECKILSTVLGEKMQDKAITK